MLATAPSCKVYILISSCSSNLEDRVSSPVNAALCAIGSSLNSIPYSPKSKSVLMVTGALARGGAERQMLHLAHGLLLAGYDVQLYELQDLAPGQPGFHAEMGALGVTSYRHSSFSQTREPAST